MLCRVFYCDDLAYSRNRCAQYQSAAQLFNSAGLGRKTSEFYWLNLVFLGSFNFLLIHAASKKEMGNLGMTKHIADWLKFRSLNVVFVWVLAAALAPFVPLVARFIFVLIFIFQPIGDRLYKKRMTT